MSIINQVLNELERRGGNASLGESAIRAVAPRKRSYVMRYVLIVAAMLLLLVLAQWYWGRAKAPVNVQVVAVAPTNTTLLASSGPVSAAVSAPAVVVSMSSDSAVVASSAVQGSLHGKPLLAVQSDEEPVVAPEVKKIAKGTSEHHKREMAETTDAASMEDLEQLKKISPQQRAENEFNKANLAVQEGRLNDALSGYEGALLIDPTFKPARRAWVAVLVSMKRNDEAEQVLQRGLKRDSHDAGFAMQLARLQVERDAMPLALETLQKTLPYAEGQADYQSFVAAISQRLGKHEEAVASYQIALKLAPNNGVWLMGMGISLQALQRNDEARTAYQRALDLKSLSPQLQVYVEQKLKEL